MVTLRHSLGYQYRVCLLLLGGGCSTGGDNNVATPEDIALINQLELRPQKGPLASQGYRFAGWGFVGADEISSGLHWLAMLEPVAGGKDKRDVFLVTRGDVHHMHYLISGFWPTNTSTELQRSSALSKYYRDFCRELGLPVATKSR